MYVWCACAVSVHRHAVSCVSLYAYVRVWMRSLVCRVGQNRMCTPYMAVYLVIFLPKHHKYTVYDMVLAKPTCMRVHTCVCMRVADPCVVS